MATSGQNVRDAEKNALLVSRKPSEIEPWLLLNINRKSYDCLPFAVVVSTAWKPKWTEIVIGGG